MKEQFCSYEITLAVKELGFDELCLGYFNENKELLLSHPSNNGKIIPDYYRNSRAGFWLSKIFSNKHKKLNICVAPLHQQVIEFFIEKFEIYIELNGTFSTSNTDGCYFSGYSGLITYKPENGLLWLNEYIDGDNYHEVRELTILKAIEITKENK